jgi:DNA repair exonuclease SbcCD ATPase subunit
VVAAYYRATLWEDVMSDLQSVTALIDRIEQRMVSLRQEVAKHEGARETIARALAEAEARVVVTGDDVEILTAVLGLLQGMEGAFQRNFQKSLAVIVTDGLCEVFDEDLEVRIEASRRADMSAIRFVVIKNGQEEGVMDSQGGGYVVVIAFLLRILLILAAQPLLRRLLILDEPFAQLSPEFRSSVAEMVKALAERLNFQMIMVTHEYEYLAIADVAIKATLKGGATHFEVITPEAPEEVVAE